MKKSHIKFPLNKKKLQINDQKHEKLVLFDTKLRPLKQNLSFYQKLEQKEEILLYDNKNQQKMQTINTKQFLLPKTVPALYNTNQRLNNEKSLSNHRSYSMKINKKLGRTLSSVKMIRNGILEFIDILQEKDMIKRSLSKLNISFKNFEEILEYIITYKNQSKNQISQTLSFLYKQSNLNKVLEQKLTKFSIKNQNKFLNNDQQFCIFSKVFNISYQSECNLNKKQFVQQDKQNKLNVKKLQILQLTKQLQLQINKKKIMISQYKTEEVILKKELEQTKYKLQKIKNQYFQAKRQIEQKYTKKSVQNYVFNQPNKIVKEAAQYHRNLQIDMFEYADFLRHHPIGRKDHQPSIYFNETHRLADLQVSARPPTTADLPAAGSLLLTAEAPTRLDDKGTRKGDQREDAIYKEVLRNCAVVVLKLPHQDLVLVLAQGAVWRGNDQVPRLQVSDGQVRGCEHWKVRFLRVTERRGSEIDKFIGKNHRIVQTWKPILLKFNNQIFKTKICQLFFQYEFNVFQVFKQFKASNKYRITYILQFLECNA